MSDHPQIDAFIVAWRVYAIADNYLSGRPEGAENWSSESADSPAPGDVLRVELGAISDAFEHADRVLNATMLTTFGGWQSKARDLDELDHQIAANAAELTPDYATRGNTWLSMQLRRPVKVTETSASKHLWVDFTEGEAVLGGFRRLASSTFDTVAPLVFGRLERWPHRLETERDLVYLEAHAKEPTTLPRATMGSGWISMGRPWESLPFEDLADAVESAGRLARKGSGELENPGRWATAALREHDDSFRRFMFAHFGLETLCNVFSAQTSRVAAVIDELTTLSGAPLHELVWPVPDDESAHPHRALVFKFTVMAIAVSRDSAADDIALFRRLHKERNQLAHGKHLDLTKLPADEAEDLLRRYLSLVGRALVQS